MSKAKKILFNARVLIAIIAIISALIAIHPNPFVEGVTIRNVVSNSTAAIAGIESPEPTDSPMSRERITAINNEKISDINDYYKFLSTLKPNRTVHLRTNRGLYKLTTQEDFLITELNETEEITEEIFDLELNKTINITKNITKIERTSIGVKDLGLSVYNSPTTNIRKGLDLQGGTRVLLQPEEIITVDEMDILIENMKYRLNVFGLSDVVVREAGDLSGNQYVLVEIAGAQEEEVKELIAKQGKFEAKVGNISVFKGGQDITYVCRSSDCSGIDPRVGCRQTPEGWACRFQFAISLLPEAAQRQANATKDLEVITDEGSEYLSEKLFLYLDDVLVDELNIGEGLKGRAETEIAISGSGVGATQQEAVYDSLDNMKKLQTVLITGSLPVKLNILKTDAISAIFGEEFISNALLVGLVAILGVALVVLIRYRTFKVALPILFTSFTEVMVLLGVAALIGWNIDLAAIAGIIIAVGTGVDHLIVITDETLKGEGSALDWKKRIKSAFSIIMMAYFTTAVAMLPLLFAGAGLLKGFAVTTLIGVTAGVFIARPAYAAIIETLLK